MEYKESKEHNLVLLIFCIIGLMVVFYYAGMFVAKMVDDHNFDKVKERKEKWFDK